MVGGGCWCSALRGLEATPLAAVGGNREWGAADSRRRYCGCGFLWNTAITLPASGAFHCHFPRG